MRNLRQLFRRTPWLDSKQQFRRRREAGATRSRPSRILRNETLEKRQLLAGDIAYAHNYWHAADVDDNQQITAGDALRVVNLLSRHGGSIEITEPGQIDSYADVNSDGLVTASDALTVINSLNRGEAAGELIDMHLNARDINDEALTTDDDRSITVDVGEVFFLELSYTDLRTFGSDIGAFQIMTDMLFESDESSAADMITPVLTETQMIVIEENIRESESGELTFSLEEGSTTHEASLAAFSSDPVGEIEDALLAFGYQENEFRVKRLADNLRTFPGQPENPDPGNLAFEIRYTDFAFAGVDLPDLQATGNFDNTVRVLAESQPPVNSDGSVNGAAAGGNLDTRSRTFPGSDPFGREVYGLVKFGEFDSSIGFDELGAIGPVAPGGIPQVVGDFPQPFDAFSIPIMINEPVTDLSVSLALAENEERVLLYGRETPVPPELILLGAGSEFTVNAVGEATNDPPVAVDDSETTQEGAAVEIDVLANDSDPDGDSLTVSLDGATAPTKGTIEVNPDQTITYTPDDGELGEDTFTYFANDGQADSNEATVTVTIVEENDPPDLTGPVEATFSEDDPDDFVDLLEGASDPDGDPLSVVDVTLVSGNDVGITVDAENNGLNITPDAYNALAFDESEIIVYDYGVTDGQGNVVDQTATVTIIGENDPPEAVDDEATADGTNPVLIDVLANDVDPDGDALTVALGTAPEFGTAEIIDNQIQYTADDNLELTDSFTYTISDGIADPVEATVTVDVFEENVPPVVEAPLEVNFTEATGVQTFDLLSGASDPNEDSLNVVDLVLSPESPLGVTVNDNIVSVDTDDYQFLAQDELSDPIDFSYSVSDGELSVSQSAVLTITGVNDPPVAVDDEATTLKNSPVDIDVLANDSDADESDTLSIDGATDGSDGTVTVNPNGTVTYTPGLDFTGQDTFTYTVTDGLETREAMVSVTVTDFAPSSVSGSIFFDHLENMDEFLDGADPIRNGVQDDDESGLGGAPVNLISAANENVTGEPVERTVHTGLHGDYSFDSVAPGTYQIVFEIPETIVFGVNGDGSAEAGVMEIVIGADGGQSFEEMNFTIVDTVDTNLGGIDQLASSFLRDNQDLADSTLGGRRGGLVSLTEGGEQMYFKALGGFDDIAFAELTLNEDRDAALLTVIDESGTLLSSRLSEDRFVVNDDGTAVQFFGGFDDFFDDDGDLVSPDSSLSDEFEDYRNAIDKVIGDFGT